MKKWTPWLLALLTTVSLVAYPADVKISQLPLGSGATVGSADSFPFVSASLNITKRLTLYDLINVPAISSTFAPKASPTFTGTVTTPALNLSGQTATTVPYLDASKNLVSSSTTPTELGRLSGVTSSLCGINQSCTLTNKTLTTPVIASITSGSGTFIHNTTGTITVPSATDTLVGKATTDTLTNKTLNGNTATNLISGSGTFTFNTTGTVTAPNATDTLVGKATTDIFTNKSISGSTNTFTNIPANTALSSQVPIANGGTGQSTKAAGFDALQPMSASGDIIYGGTAGTGTRLAKGADGTFLTLSSGLPAWATVNTNLSVVSKTTTYTATSTDGLINVDATGGAWTLTFPAAGSNTGKVWTVVRTDSTLANGVTISVSLNGATRKLMTQYESVQLADNGSSYTVLSHKTGAGNIAFTPGTNGFGTPTSVNFIYNREGDCLNEIGRFAAGTPTAAEARVNLPTGLTVDSTKITNNQRVGQALSSDSGATTITNIIAQAGSAYLNLSNTLAGTSGATLINGNSFLGTGTTGFFQVNCVPITDWWN